MRTNLHNLLLIGGVILGKFGLIQQNMPKMCRLFLNGGALLMQAMKTKLVRYITLEHKGQSIYDVIKVRGRGAKYEG